LKAVDDDEIFYGVPFHLGTIVVSCLVPSSLYIPHRQV